MSGRCNHGSDSVLTVLRLESMAVAAHELWRPPTAEPVAPGPSSRPEAGHSRLDPQPPKSTS
jgi:hypothetical protein